MLTTFILSRNECNQIHEYEEFYNRKIKIAEKIAETEEILAEKTKPEVVKTCETFDELPENWKKSESWRVGFIEAPQCPEKELMIIVNTAHKNTKNRAILRRYFSGKLLLKNSVSLNPRT